MECELYLGTNTSVLNF